MQTIEINVYDYQELSEEAKKNARDWFSINDEYWEFSDCMASIQAFCREFGIENIDYQFSAFGYCYITSKDSDSVFRGRKLKEFNPDHEPTGYWTDYTLWNTFYQTFKETGDCKGAFNEALDKVTAIIKEDMEYHYSDEYIEEMFNCNDYRFYEDGSIYKG